MLVAFSGLGGAGKTTAIESLERCGFGRRVYLGEAVSEEMKHRGLVRTPEVEQEVRMELRSRLGPSAFADLRASHITDLIRGGECVFIDAIFKREEFDRLLLCGQDRSVLIAIEASFATRAARLMARKNRGYSADDLRIRDRTEIDDLGTSSVMKSADFTISNECSLNEFYDEVASLWKRINSLV